MPLTKQEIWQRQARKRKLDPAYKEKDRLRAKKKRDAPFDDAAKEKIRQQTKLRTRQWRQRKNAQSTNNTSRDDSISSTSTRRSRYERWINRNDSEMSFESSNPEINVMITSSTPNTSFQNSDFNNALPSMLPVVAATPFLRPNLPAIKKSVNRYKRELSNTRKKYMAKSEESTKQQRTIWKLQKRLKTLESENNQESVESPTTSSQNANVENILKGEGLIPSQYPKLVKELLVNEVLVSSFNSQTIDKKTVFETKIARYLSNRLSIDRRHWIRKKKIISARQLLSNEMKTKITAFLTRPDNATCLPGKKDALKIKKKEKAQVYILSDYLKNVFNKYIMENPSSHCKFSTFCKARPRYVRTAKYNSRTTCLCTHHQNLHLKLKALRPRFSERPDTFIKENTDAEINEKMANFQNESVSYEEWRRVETRLPNGKLKYNTRLVKVEVPVDEFKESFKIQVGKFREHAYRVTTQYSEVKRLKDHMEEDEATLQMDFAQNYTCGHTEEIQSAYFAKEQVTLHPMVLHYKEGNELRHKSFVAVSDERAHNSFAVFAFIKTIIPRIKEMLPNLCKIHYLTDSPTSQYRNKKIMNLIARHETIFEMKATWTYFESGHGKGPCDGVGGTLKRLADDVSKMGTASIIDAETFFSWAQSLETLMDIYWVSKAEIDEAKLEIESWTMIVVPECMKLHAVVVRNEGIFTRHTSCFKECCNQHGIPPICQGWVCTPLEIPQPQPEPRLQPQPEPRPQPQPQSDSIHYDINDYIAAKYNADWYIGRILEVNPEEVKVTFMERAGSLMSYTFCWPFRKDILWVSLKDVIIKVSKPEEYGSRRRPTMKLCDLDLQKVLDKFVN